MGDQSFFSSFHSDIGIPIKLHEQSGLGTFSSIELRGRLEVSRDVRLPVQMRRKLGFTLGSPHRIQTSRHLVR